jgi:hypothetical protein
MRPLVGGLLGGHRRGDQPPVAKPAVGAPAAGQVEDRRCRPGRRPFLLIAPFVGTHDEDPYRRLWRLLLGALHVLVQEGHGAGVEVDQRVRAEVHLTELSRGVDLVPPRAHQQPLAGPARGDHGGEVSRGAELLVVVPA